MPPTSETELLDLGSTLMLGAQSSMNGVPIYSIDRTEISAADFYWLIPSNYKQTDSGITFNTENLIDIMIASGVLGSSPESRSLEIQQIRAAISELGLETITGNSDFSWNWDGDQGGMETAMLFDLDNLMKTTTDLAMTGPSLTGWETLLSSEQPDFISAPIFFNKYSLSLTDYELLDRSYAYAATQLGGGTADDMRASLPSLLRVSGGQVSDFSPRIPGYIDALATFMGESGSVTATANPESPVVIAEILQASQVSPISLLELLNVDVQHTP